MSDKVENQMSASEFADKLWREDSNIYRLSEPKRMIQFAEAYATALASSRAPQSDPDRLLQRILDWLPTECYGGQEHEQEVELKRLRAEIENRLTVASSRAPEGASKSPEPYNLVSDLLGKYLNTMVADLGIEGKGQYLRYLFSKYEAELARASRPAGEDR